MDAGFGADVEEPEHTQSQSSSRQHPQHDAADSGDRASLYSELHSYLDDLQQKHDFTDEFDDSQPLSPAARDAWRAQVQARSATSVLPASAMEAIGLASPSSSSATAARLHTPTSVGRRPLSHSSPPNPRPPSTSERESKEPSPPQRRNLTPGTILPLSPNQTQQRLSTPNRPGAASQRSHAAVTSPPATASQREEEKDAMLDPSFIEGDPSADALPPGDFDETQEMEKIAQLDALIAEADQRSHDMEQRLLALMAAPLPIMPGENDDPIAALADQLLLMPGSPARMARMEAAAAAGTNGSNLTSPTNASAGADGAAGGGEGGFFMTSVPGVGSDGGVTSPTAAKSTSSASQKLSASEAAAAAAAAAVEANMWTFEEVDPIDAPLLLSSGEGFRPTDEDQGKLDEIDALLDHFRSSDRGLSAGWRPRFVHPPGVGGPAEKAARKKRAAAGARKRAAAAAAAEPRDAADQALTFVEQPQEDDDVDDAASEMPLPDSAVASRISALISTSSASSNGSLLTFALSSTSATIVPSASSASDGLEPAISEQLSVEEQKELRAWNRQLKKMQKAAANPHADRSSERNNPALQVDSEYLKKLLAKTQKSASAAGAGEKQSSFPTFSFPKNLSSTTSSGLNSAGSVVGLSSTDAIFAAMEREEKEKKRAARKAATANAAPTVTASSTSLDSRPISAEQAAREAREAMLADSADSDGGGGEVVEEGEEDEEEEEEEAEEDPDSETDATGPSTDSSKSIPRNPRARMDALAAQIAAIRAKTLDETGEWKVEPREKESSTQGKADGSNNKRGNAARRSLEPAVSSSTSTSNSRPHSEHAENSFEESFASLSMTPSNHLAASPVSSSHITASPFASPVSSGSASAAAYSLADRLDRALSNQTRPGSSSSQIGSARLGSAGAAAGGSIDSWRTWQPRSDLALSGADELVEASSTAGARIRAAARGQAAVYGNPSPRLSPGPTGSVSVRSSAPSAQLQRPLRALASASGRPDSVGSSSMGYTQTARGERRLDRQGSASSIGGTARGGVRPLSASSVHSSLDFLPPPVSSNKLQSTTAKWK